MGDCCELPYGSGKKDITILKLRVRIECGKELKERD